VASAQDLSPDAVRTLLAAQRGVLVFGPDAWDASLADAARDLAATLGWPAGAPARLGSSVRIWLSVIELCDTHPTDPKQSTYHELRSSHA
jgi:hypothetical protein